MAGKQQRRPSHEEAEETQRTILRTAQKLFMEYGYRAVSTRQIAIACGLTQPALYHHFADKKALYAAVIQENLVETGAALERISRRNESVHERLRQCARYLLSNVQYNHSLMFHDIRYQMDADVQQMLGEAFHARMITPLSTIFEDGLRQRTLRDQQHGGVDAIAAAYLFLNVLERFLTSTSYRQYLTASATPATSIEEAEVIVHILLYGLANVERACPAQMLDPEQTE